MLKVVDRRGEHRSVRGRRLVGDPEEDRAHGPFLFASEWSALSQAGSIELGEAINVAGLSIPWLLRHVIDPRDRMRRKLIYPDEGSRLRSTEHKPVWAKLARLQRGCVARVLDLFSGCGGLSLGLQRAGFEILAGLDSDPQAAASHALNFHEGCHHHVVPRDVTDPEVTPGSLCASLGLGPVAEAVDIVIGGPPCQAFARIGRAKLRAIAGDPKAFLRDPRAGLHERWLAWVRELEPLAVLVENVPDALNGGHRNIAQEICHRVGRTGLRHWVHAPQCRALWRSANARADVPHRLEK